MVDQGSVMRSILSTNTMYLMPHFAAAAVATAAAAAGGAAVAAAKAHQNVGSCKQTE
jgi:hypothetical protein